MTRSLKTITRWLEWMIVVGLLMTILAIFLRAQPESDRLTIHMYDVTGLKPGFFDPEPDTDPVGEAKYVLDSFLQQMESANFISTTVSSANGNVIEAWTGPTKSLMIIRSSPSIHDQMHRAIQLRFAYPTGSN